MGPIARRRQERGRFLRGGSPHRVELLQGTGSDIYYAISGLSAILAVVLLGVGLYNNEGLELSEKGFFGIAFLMSLFAAIAVQKNTRDIQKIQKVDASE